MSLATTTDHASPSSSPSPKRGGHRRMASAAVATGLATAAVLSASPMAHAAPTPTSVAMGDASGVVAVYTGSFGYKEIVFGKATTRRIASSAAGDIIPLISGVAGLWGVPFALYAYLYKYRAQDAVNTGQCFAVVRLPGSTAWWPAKESRGCR